MSYKTSQSHLERARKVIPLASQTFSKCYTQLSVGAAPLFLDRGLGSHVWDIDGNEFIDQILSLGPIILGHHNEEVDRTVVEQTKKGNILSLPGILEAEMAEKICSIVPSAEMVRYGKNGSDVTAAAVRIARAYTGRDLIACGGYHGWQDWYIGTTTRNKGVPQAVRNLTKTFTYNNIESLEKVFAEHPNQVAAVILEPIGVEFPQDDFLQKVASLTRKNGAVLIFDEMITGFRIALGGAQSYFGVTPDLSCFGKAVANGYPLSIIAGNKELMRECEEIFFSFTFGGDLLSLAAGLTTLTILERDNVVVHINTVGMQLQNAYNEIAERLNITQYTKAIGYGSHFVNTFKNAGGSDDQAARTVFQENMVAHGVLTIGGNNTCFAYSESDVRTVINAYEATLATLSKGYANRNMDSLIKGTKLQPVFRKP